MVKEAHDGKSPEDILTREGVSAYRVCKDLGLDKGQLSRFLNGKSNLTLIKIERIADYLGYDLQMVKRKSSRKGA